MGEAPSFCGGKTCCQLMAGNSTVQRSFATQYSLVFRVRSALLPQCASQGLRISLSFNVARSIGIMSLVRWAISDRVHGRSSRKGTDIGSAIRVLTDKTVNPLRTNTPMQAHPLELAEPEYCTLSSQTKLMLRLAQPGSNLVPCSYLPLPEQ